LLRCSLPALNVLVLAVCSSAPARAVTVGVAPADTTVYLGDEFALGIVTSDFAGLKGFDLLFSFDPTRLKFLGADAGDVLTGSGRTFTDYTLVAHGAVADSILYDAAMLDGATRAPGSWCPSASGQSRSATHRSSARRWTSATRTMLPRCRIAPAGWCTSSVPRPHGRELGGSRPSIARSNARPTAPSALCRIPPDWQTRVSARPGVHRTKGGQHSSGHPGRMHLSRSRPADAGPRSLLTEL